MKKQLHEFYVTHKCTKMEYFTVKAESMEEAEWEADKNPKLDFDLIQNQNRIYKY